MFPHRRLTIVVNGLMHLCLLGRSDAHHSIQDVQCACDWGEAIPILLQSFKHTSSLERGQDTSRIL